MDDIKGVLSSLGASPPCPRRNFETISSLRNRPVDGIIKSIVMGRGVGERESRLKGTTCLSVWRGRRLKGQSLRCDGAKRRRRVPQKVKGRRRE